MVDSADEVRSSTQELLEEAGFSLEELTVAANRRVIEFVVDRLDDRPEAVSLHDIARATEVISEALDPLPVFGDTQYQLEVMSPGATRPMTQVRHFRRNLGRRISVTVGERTFEGELLDVSDSEITMEPLKQRGRAMVRSGEHVVIPIADIDLAQPVLSYR